MTMLVFYASDDAALGWQDGLVLGGSSSIPGFFLLQVVLSILTAYSLGEDASLHAVVAGHCHPAGDSCR